MGDGFDPVRPCRPVAGYIGGKKKLAGRLVERIEAVPHSLYTEPFVGMGGVFLRRGRRPKVEAINDASRDIATFFRVLQRHLEAFRDMLKWQISSRAEFERLRAQEPDSLTDLERAARFLYLQRLTFGGKVSGRTFGVSTDRGAPFDVTRLFPLLEEVHERLAGVWIDCRGWEEFLQRWDRPEALHFVDPPYWGTEEAYGRGVFTRDAFARLADVLRALQGRFILTLNDVPEVRELFAWAEIEPVSLTYSVGSRNDQPADELVISN